MLNDRRAKRAWRLYRLRVELQLSSVSPAVRRELLADLSAHVREMLAHDVSGDDEYTRLQAALQRLGDPREFLAPFAGAAIFREPGQDIGPWRACRSLGVLLQRGSRLAWQAFSLLTLGAAGAFALLVGVGGLLRPENVGVFVAAPGDLQIRLFGGQGGAAVLAPWLSLAFAALGAALFVGAWRGARRLLLIRMEMRLDDQ